MKRQTLWLALAVSVLFNVFFLAGYLQARWERSTSATPPATRIADELRLDDGQAAIFGHLRAGLEEDNRVFAERLALVQQEMYTELTKPAPDLDRIEALMNQDGELRRDAMHAAHERFRAFVGMLSPDQRQRLLRHLDRGPRHGQRRRMLMRRFDRDGDGSLDEAERAAAEEFMQQRQREREGRRERMLERFDANDDGELDAGERAEMRRWFESQKNHDNEI